MQSSTLDVSDLVESDVVLTAPLTPLDVSPPITVNGNGNGTTSTTNNGIPLATPTPVRPIERPTDQRIEALKQVFEHHRHSRLLIILQDFPDPDALSSAWALKLIAEKYDIQSDIAYAGALSHQENITLVRLTNLPLIRWNPQAKGKDQRDISIYQGYILVDNQGTTSQLLAIAKQANLPAIAIIDHHALQDNLTAEFTDIRPNIRATATILTQYLQAGLLQLDSSKTDHVKCATALMHGIRSDTDCLKQAREEDFLAAAYLSKFCDSQLLNTVLLSHRSKQVMDVIERSLKNRSIHNNFLIAGVGYLRYEDRDAIPQAADFLVTEENVHTAVVYGLVHDEDEEVELIVGSLRTTKITLDPDEFIKEAFGQDNQGRFFGGGRSQAGGFEIPVGFLAGLNANPEYAKLKWNVYDTQIKQKLLHLVNPKNNVLHTTE